MQDKHLFEYAVIRVVPKVEREEFINVGVVIYCHKKRYLRVKTAINEEKLKVFAPALDLEAVKEHLEAFERISQGQKAGPIGKLDVASRFRWLTATRSTIIQSSKVHPAFGADLDAALQKLFEQFVL